MARTLTYNPALDGLRALAVMAVVAQHFSYPIIGFYGVSVFFVLSGYLITSLLLAEREGTGTVDMRAFYRRRFARLSPALVLAVAAVLVWVLATGQPIRTWFAGLIGSLSYTTDLIELTPWQHNVSSNFEWSWSLAVEEQFYLVWPALILLLFAVGRSRFSLLGGRRGLAIACVGFIAIAWVLRLQMVASHASAGRVHFSPEAHIDALALGALLALFASGRHAFFERHGVLVRRVAGIAAVFAAVFLVLALKKDGPFATIASQYAKTGYGTVALASAVLVAGLVLAPRSLVARGLGWRVLVYVGKLSYGIYLWNMLVKHMYQKATGWDTGTHRWAELVAFGVLLLICDLSFRFVETPLRKRWAHKKVPLEFTTQKPEVASVGA